MHRTFTIYQPKTYGHVCGKADEYPLTNSIEFMDGGKNVLFNARFYIKDCDALGIYCDITACDYLDGTSELVEGLVKCLTQYTKYLCCRSCPDKIFSRILKYDSHFINTIRDVAIIRAQNEDVYDPIVFRVFPELQKWLHNVFTSYKDYLDAVLHDNNDMKNVIRNSCSKGNNIFALFDLMEKMDKGAFIVFVLLFFCDEKFFLEPEKMEMFNSFHYSVLAWLRNGV